MMSDPSRGEAPWPSYALPFGTAVHGYRIERVLGWTPAIPLKDTLKRTLEYYDENLQRYT